MYICQLCFKLKAHLAQHFRRCQYKLQNLITYIFIGLLMKRKCCSNLFTDDFNSFLVSVHFYIQTPIRLSLLNSRQAIVLKCRYNEPQSHAPYENSKYVLSRFLSGFVTKNKMFIIALQIRCIVRS